SNLRPRPIEAEYPRTPSTSGGWTDGFAELVLAARAHRDGVALGGRVMLTRLQPKGVPHVTIASAYDRGHEAGGAVVGHAGPLHQGRPRACRSVSAFSGPAQRGGGPRLSPRHA